MTTFLRDAWGLLVNRSDALICAHQTGGNGVYEHRHELSETFHSIGKHRLAEWAGTLLDREALVMAMVDSSKLVLRSVN